MQSIDNNEMQVQKRNGTFVAVSFDKILRRVKSTGAEANIKVNFTALVMKVIDQLYDGITTTQIDELSGGTRIGWSLSARRRRQDGDGSRSLGKDNVWCMKLGRWASYRAF